MKRDLLFILLILVLVCCKARKLKKESSQMSDKTRTEVFTTLKESTTNTNVSTQSEEKTFSDQSGTWIWEKWYQGEPKSGDVTKGSCGEVIYERTTYVKSDIKNKEASTERKFESNANFKDSSTNITVQKDVELKKNSKDLEAKPTPSSWMWPLALLILSFLALAFILRRGR